MRFIQCVYSYTVGSISKNAALEIWARDGRKLESTRETLVTNGIVVLQSDLTLDSLNEVALLTRLVFTVAVNILSSRVSKDVTDSLVKERRV